MTTRYKEVFEFLKKHVDEGTKLTSEQFITFTFPDLTEEERPVIDLLVIQAWEYDRKEYDILLEVMKRNGFCSKFISIFCPPGHCRFLPKDILDHMGKQKLGGLNNGVYNKTHDGTWKLRTSNG